MQCLCGVQVEFSASIGSPMSHVSLDCFLVGVECFLKTMLQKQNSTLVFNNGIFQRGVQFLGTATAAWLKTEMPSERTTLPFQCAKVTVDGCHANQIVELGANFKKLKPHLGCLGVFLNVRINYGDAIQRLCYTGVRRPRTCQILSASWY